MIQNYSTIPNRQNLPEHANFHTAYESTDQNTAVQYRSGPIANGPQSRDASVTRGRNIHNTAQGSSTSSRAPSAHPAILESDSETAGIASTANSSKASATPTSLDTATTGLQRRVSNRHHRQTSVINGLQHSRNPSFNSPLASSPLSPESLHNANIRNGAWRRGQPSSMERDVSASPTAAFALSAHLHTPSIESTLNSASAQSIATVTHHPVTRIRRGQIHESLSSIQSEPRTPAEYALAYLLTTFEQIADQKIYQCLSRLDALPLPIEQTCGPGADAGFDQLLRALAHTTRQRPRPLVDFMMVWRQKRADDANNCRKMLGQHRSPASMGSGLPASLLRRHTEPVQEPGLPTMPPDQSLHHQDEYSSEDYVLLDRHATVAIFILCRGLKEVFSQSTLEAITPEVALKLEDIVFDQLQSFEPQHLQTNKIRAANWRIYGQLLGCIGKLDFARVTNLYLQKLRMWQQEIASNTGTTVKVREVETRIELLLSSMQNIQLLLDHTGFVQSCEFLNAVARLFADSHGPRIKQSYCALFETLLLQITPQVALAENSSRFKDFIDVVNPRINQMLTKMRHWTSALPTSIALLCLSNMDVFNSQWMLQINALINKLRDRTSRTPAMRSICQLTWTYLTRSSDSAAGKARRVEELVRLVFPPGRKPHITTDPSMAEAVLCFVRLIGFGYPELCFRLIVFPLINTEYIMSTRDIRIDQLEPEKVTIGIQSTLLLIEDKESKSIGWPAFPVFKVPLSPLDNIPSSPMPFTGIAVTEKPMQPKKVEFSTSTAPVPLALLDEQTRGCFMHFCEVLGKITILCDNAFGSSATLSERFSAAAPKTPLVDAFTITKREDGSVQDPRVLYYELLDVAIQALPRCMSDSVPLNVLINLLCTGSAHVQTHIARAATRSLKAIASQGHAQSVAIAFPRFIFNYDHQYSTMSDDGRLGPNHIEATLALYLELLHVWLEQIQRKVKATLASAENANDSNTTRSLQMEMTNALSLVDETEGYGLFFLCSQSRKVRGYAIKVLEIVRQFDKAFGKDDQTRIVHILDTHSEQILDIPEDSLTLLERSRLQKDKQQKGAQNILVEISSSEVYYDSTLWTKAFPNLIRHIFETCPHAIVLSREVVCDRLALMQPDVERLAQQLSSSRDLKLIGRSSDTPLNVFFEQWMLYLVMACVTLSSPGGQTQSQLATATHGRKTSRNTSGLQDKLSSARALFSAVIPMLGSGLEPLRFSVVTALGCINRKLHRTLLESLQYAVITCNDEAKARVGAHQRTPSSPSRSQMTERMRIEVTCIYKLTAAFLKHDETAHDEWILNNLMNYAKELRLFLSDSDVQSDWKFSRLRYHYCGLIETIYVNITRLPETSHWMSFESRKSAFTLMEDWCGYGSDAPGAFRLDYEPGDQGAIAKERNNLKIAALNAMAALCTGPVSVVTENNTLLQFNVPRILSWIDSVFEAPERKLHDIGQKALRNLIKSNPTMSVFAEHAVQCCYGLKGVTALENCFNVVADVMMHSHLFPISIIKVLGAAIFTLGHENRDVRIKSSRLLRFLDDREQKKSNLQHFDISISDKTRAVYKTAQFEYSRRLAQTHPDRAFHVFSEFCLQFRSMSLDIQRNMVAAILPWLQTLELQISEAGDPTGLSYMLLVNMVEITVQSSRLLHNEVQALWQALATGPHGGNVQLILDFIIRLSLERREQNFVGCAKQIVVYLSTTPAGSRIFEHFLLLLSPKLMPNDKNLNVRPIPEVPSVPYLANLETVLPMGNKQGSLTLGQVAMVFLVDLLVPPVQLGEQVALKLLHAVLILWDHHTPIVQEHAREMLVHLMHVLIVARIHNGSSSVSDLAAAEELVESIRNEDSQVIWYYTDFAGKHDFNDTGNRLPAGMPVLTRRLVGIFSTIMNDFSDAWAKEALHWASVCPVRHLACRSFQIFRCISNKLDSSLLSDMLARLSNTISDAHADFQTFSLEILITLRSVVANLEMRDLLKYPQIFWTTIACLDTIHECEFSETLGMLEVVVDFFDFTDASALLVLTKAQPTDWEGEFNGIEPLVYRGLKSSTCFERTFKVLSKLSGLPKHDLIGKQDRLLFNTLAYLPWLSHSKRSNDSSEQVSELTSHLIHTAQADGAQGIALALQQSLKASSVDFTFADVLQALKTAFFPRAETNALIFVLGLLTNTNAWYRTEILNILQDLIPLTGLKTTSTSQYGTDLISPLLHLIPTAHCDHALKILDLVVENGPSSIERHQPKLSNSSAVSRIAHKDQGPNQGLYGIPEESGWSVPAPSVHALQTRNNVHHVFFMCGGPDSADGTPAETPEVEFATEDETSDSYFPSQILDNNSSTFSTAHTYTNMGDIVSSLDSLDDFFEDNSPITPTGDARTYGLKSPASLYEPQSFVDGGQSNSSTIPRSDNYSASATLYDSLTHPRHLDGVIPRMQPSFIGAIHSYQNSFTSNDEAEGPGPSMPTFENRPPLLSTQTAIHLSRPVMNGRSVTSPTNQLPKAFSTVGMHNRPIPTSNAMMMPASPFATEDMLSDSESSPFPTLGASATPTSDKHDIPTPTSAADTTGNFMRRGVRRLTGGKSESAKEKARLKAPSSGTNQYGPGTSGTGQSPRMPRIPSEYANNVSTPTGTTATTGTLPMSPGQQN